MDAVLPGLALVSVFSDNRLNIEPNSLKPYSTVISMPWKRRMNSALIVRTTIARIPTGGTTIVCVFISIPAKYELAF